MKSNLNLSPCSLEYNIYLQKKRSLASHLSGYDPSKIKGTSDSRSELLPETTKETTSLEEHNLDESPCSRTVLTTETYSGDALVNSDAMTFSRLSEVQHKNMKFLVPVVHRSRVWTLTNNKFDHFFFSVSSSVSSLCQTNNLNNNVNFGPCRLLHELINCMQCCSCMHPIVTMYCMLCCSHPI